MSKCTTVEIEQRIGSEVEHFVSLAPKKNHGAMMQLNQQYGEIIKNYGVPHLVFQLSNTMAGITNTANYFIY